MRTCAICPNQFQPRAPNLPPTDKRYQRYCSRACYRRAKQIRGASETRHEQDRDRARLRRREILRFLGGCCSNTACGFSDWRALQIDHVNGGGLKEWREIGGNPRELYRRVRESPHEYQCLCANCNWIKRHERGEGHGASPERYKLERNFLDINLVDVPD